MAARLKREALTRERILRTALQILDNEGLESISMRRVAEALGVEAMSLYNHVANKAAILNGIFEIVLAELRPARSGKSWTSALRAQAHVLRKALCSHPNALPLFSTRPAVTPASISHVEAVLEILRTAGFPGDEALSALQVMVAFVVGHTVATHSPGMPDGATPQYESLDEGVFPRVREAARLLPHHSSEREFEFGLDALLEGLELRLARRKGASK